MIWKPNVTVAAVICSDNRFLMVEETVAGRLVINQPAGHLEKNERLVDAAVRETLEETAWEFVPSGLVGIYQWDHPNKDLCFLRFTFWGSAQNNDSLRQLDEGIIRAVWMTRDELLAQSGRCRSPMVIRCIDDYLGGQRYPLSSLKTLAAFKRDHQSVSS